MRADTNKNQTNTNCPSGSALNPVHQKEAAPDPCPKRNRSSAERVRFGKEEQRNERALPFEKSRSKLHIACSDVVEMRGVEPLSEDSSTVVSTGVVIF